MIIKVGNFECTEVWDGVFYKKLSRYPQITDWELRTIIEFIEYERKYGRKCRIECEDTELLKCIYEKIRKKEIYLKAARPALLTECTACPYRKGCETEFVCHTTSAENAIKIFQSGKLLSAVKARNVPVEQLVKESRNAANDPADYFEYIMFAWGNCQAGVRFYFRYEELITHSRATFDGVLPVKVKDEIVLSDWVYKIIVPAEHRLHIEPHIPDLPKDRIIYVENDCQDIWD